jgi:hypothetical protein
MIQQEQTETDMTVTMMEQDSNTQKQFHNARAACRLDNQMGHHRPMITLPNQPNNKPLTQHKRIEKRMALIIQ